jgi:hypothetical protein
MRIIEKIKRVFRRTPKLSDRERLRNQIVKEVALSSALAGFLCHGFNRGRSAKITVEIDGLSCEIGLLASPKEPLMEYFANWACAEKLRKEHRLSEFDVATSDYERDRVKMLAEVEKLQQANSGVGNLGAAPKNGGK